MKFHLLIFIISVVIKPIELKSVRQLRKIDNKTFKTINSRQNNDRRDDAEYAPNIVSLNDRGAMPEAENMLKLRVPKAINIGDVIRIEGDFKEDKQIFEFYATGGISEPDMSNFDFCFKIDFQAKTALYGNSSVTHPIDDLISSKITDFKIEMRFPFENVTGFTFNGDSVDIKDEIPINNITFIVLKGDISHLSSLWFQYDYTK